MAVKPKLRHLAASLLVCSALSGAVATLAQDPTATPLPVKATPVPTDLPVEAPVEVTAEATLDAQPEVEVTETPIGDLAYNTPVVGRITNDAPAQDWPLPLASADRVTFVVTRLDGNLIPDIIVLDESGDQIGSSYGAEEDYATALLDNVRFEEAGNYTVRVARERGADGATAGLYELTVIPLAVAVDAAPNTDIVGEVTIDAPVTGTLTSEHWYQRYTYNADAADNIRVVVERTIGTLEPMIYVLDSEGSSLATGYAESTGDIASTNRVNLPEAGEYTVVVTRASEFNGDTTGSYDLTVEMIGSGEGSPNLAGTAGDIVYNQPLKGTITPVRWYEDWTLTAEAGDSIAIHVQRDSSNNLMPEVMLLGGSGQEITRGYTSNTGDSASINRRTLDGPGEYTVRVTRRSGQTGETSGSYTLTVNLIGSGEGSAALQGTTGTIALGEAVEGEVTNERWADSWSFSATQGERVMITVERTSGTLVPRVQVRDRNGQSLTDGYPENTADIVMRQFNPPSTGEFIIVVMREREQEGVTRGEYRLTVAADS